MCKRCQTCKKMGRGSLWKAQLVPLPVIEVPFTIIAMDMVGPLLRTEEGHRFILTIVDYGSRFPDAIPLKTTTSYPICTVRLQKCHTSIHWFQPIRDHLWETAQRPA